MKPVFLPGHLYQVIPGFEDHLNIELSNAGLLYPGTDLYHIQEPPTQKIFWHQNCWLEPFRLEFSSINEASAVLRNIQRNWSACLLTLFRRGALITSKLPPISSKPRPFPWEMGNSPVGIWTLLNEHTIIASARCSSPFPNGIIKFTEDKEEPPSRAYLKLWEILTRLRKRPASGERCLDAGASPGSWSWALARLGANVIAVDKAPLEERIAVLPNVEYIRRDVFTMKPEDIGSIDWLFCDVACYPPRLYDWIEKWLVSGLCRNFVCTIKMQGTANSKQSNSAIDFKTPRRFAEIPGSEVVHLYHNKHELTWTLIMQK